MNFQEYVDQVNFAGAVLSVEQTEDGYCGEIHIICANEKYKQIMGPGYYDGMPYYELVPKETKFEDFCFRAAIRKQKMQTYVRTEALHVWTDMTLIPLEGGNERLGYCLFLFEFTEEPEVSRMSTVSLQTAQALVSYCIRLLGAEDFKESVHEALGDLAAFAEAPQCRILLKDDERKTVVDFCEAANEASAGLYHGTVPLPYELVSTWEAMLDQSNCVIVKDEHDMDDLAKRNPVWVKSMRDNDVSTLVLMPLRYNKKSIGYLFLTNFNTDRLVEVKELVETVAYILGTAMANYLLMQQMEWMSTTDALTGVRNRNSMTQRMQELINGGADGPMGVINMDLNELKTMNDTKGHDAGDELLRYVANRMKDIFGAEDLYRAGGDEFIAVITGRSREFYEHKLQQLRDARELDPVFNIAFGECWTEDGTRGVEEVFQQADRRMYMDKREYYAHHPEKDRRHRNERDSKRK